MKLFFSDVTYTVLTAVVGRDKSCSLRVKPGIPYPWTSYPTRKQPTVPDPYPRVRDPSDTPTHLTEDPTTFRHGRRKGVGRGEGMLGEEEGMERMGREWGVPMDPTKFRKKLTPLCIIVQYSRSYFYYATKTETVGGCVLYSGRSVVRVV